MAMPLLGEAIAAGAAALIVTRPIGDADGAR